MSRLTRPARRFLGRPDDAYPGFVPPSASDEAAGTRPLPGAANRAGRLWMVQAITGGLLLVFLGVHLIAQHLLVPAGLRDYEAVVSYLRQPLALIAELGLLGSVIVHVVLGLRASFVEMVQSRAWLRRITVALWAGGAIAFAYAIWLTAVVVLPG
jgi:succinate dehydrogenase hydrophobic anchor subunit